MATHSDVPELIRKGQELLRQGDEEAAHQTFLEAGQRLYDRHAGKLLAQCTWKFGDAGRDLVQEIFQLLWQKMPELEHPDAIEGWLYHVRDNKVLQNGRNTGRRKLILEEKRRPIAETVHGAPPEAPEEVVMSREEDRQHQDVLRRLPQVLEQLDVDEQTLLRMRFHLNLSYADIGVAIGASEATARRRLRSTLNHLNDELLRQRRAT